MNNAGPQTNQLVRFHSLNNCAVQFTGVVKRRVDDKYTEVHVNGEKTSRLVRTVRLNVVRQSFAGNCL